MATSFVVSTGYRGKDIGITKTLAAMEKRARSFGKTSERAFKRASKSATSFGTITKSIVAASAVQRGIGLLQQGIAGIATEFVNFDDAITASSAKFKGLNLATEEGQKTLLALKKTAREVGKQTQFSATQAAQGHEFMAMAGFTAAQSMALLPGVVDLATAANMDLARSTDIASDAIGAFGLATDDTTQLTKNFTRINDVMAKTVTETNTDMEQLFETIKFGASPFTAAGQEMETFNAIAGRMAANGIKGSMAGTALRSAILRLQKPTKDVMIGLDKFGISVEELSDPATGKLKDMVDIMAMMERRGKTLNTVQRNAALTAIVGKNAVSGWAAVMNEGVIQTAALKQSLLDAEGASARMADIMRNSFGPQLAMLKSALIEVGIGFFTAFETQGKTALQSLTTAIQNFDPAPLISAVQTAIRLGTALWHIASVVMPPLIAGWIAYNVALKAQVASMAIAHFLKFTRVLIIMARAKGAMTAAQWALNIAMRANPIGLMIAGAVALIALFVTLEKKFNIIAKIKGFFGAGEGPETPEGGSAAAAAPNRELAEARAGSGTLNARLDIAGAPEGSTVTQPASQAKQLDVSLLGAQ